MADQTPNIPVEAASQAAVSDAAPDFIDIDEVADSIDEEVEAQSDASAKKELFEKSTDIRRRIEERLEVRLLKDELGIDDFDLE